MTEGLIDSFTGRVGICLFFVVAGFITSVVLAFLFGFRNGAQFSTQYDHMTGKRTLGLVAWFVGWASGLVGLPVLALIIVTGAEVTNRISAANGWPLLATGLALVAVLVFGIRHMQKREPKAAPVSAPVLPPTPVPQPGYFLPDNADQWPR